LAAGCQRVWVIYPAEQKVLGYGPSDQVQAYDLGKNLEAPELIPGFALPVAELFD
jgi:Uma2 family endonuclease